MAGVRPRNRPRKRSVNFRRVWRVVLREAALNIVLQRGQWYSTCAELRAHLWRLDNYEVRALATRALTLEPGRRLHL
jgi:hypothetical protein